MKNSLTKQIETARDKHGLNERNVKSLLRHTVKELHATLSEMERAEAEQEPVAARVKRSRKSKPASTAANTATTEAANLRLLPPMGLAPVTASGLTPSHDEDSAEWQLFLASLQYPDVLPDPEEDEEDGEYQCSTSEEDGADDGEEFRNDRAVHIPRKELNDIKRLADKKLTRRPKTRHIFTDAQQARMTKIVSGLVTLGGGAVVRTLQSKAEECTGSMRHMLHNALQAAGPTATVARTTLGPRKHVRKQFLPVEDRLLTWGLEHFASHNMSKNLPGAREWDLIHRHCLPIYTPRQIFLRFKNLSTRSTNNEIKEWRARHTTQPRTRGRFESETLTDSEVEFECERLDDPDSDTDIAVAATVYLSDTSNEMFDTDRIDACSPPPPPPPVRKKKLTIKPRRSPKRRPVLRETANKARAPLTQ